MIGTAAQGSASARTAFETAERLWESTQPEPSEREEAQAALYVLYRECVARCAVALQQQAVPPTAALSQAPAELHESGPAPEPLSPAAVLAARLNAIRMLELAEAPQRAIEATRTHRLRMAGVLLVSGLLVCGLVSAGFLWIFKPKDLALGHPWKTSSKMADCHPEVPECAGIRTGIFFHTNEEENPWFEWDLEAPTKFSSMTIENRKDLGMNRTMPLIIEVGDDEKTWREVARREVEFSTWRPRFGEQTARYIRLRIPRRVYFHLEAARVHP